MAFSWGKRHSTFEVLLYTNWRTAIKPVPFKLKPVPFKLKPVPFVLKPVPFKLQPAPFSSRRDMDAAEILFSIPNRAFSLADPA